MTAASLKALVAILAAGLLLLGACSGDDDDDAARDDAENPGTGANAEAASRPSAGCGTSTAAAGQERVTLQSGGVERWYFRHVPPAHDGEEPVPLVLDFHGYSEGAEVHTMHSQLGEFGDGEGFVTLTPHARGEVPFWDIGVGSPDIDFIGAVLDDAEAALCIDLARVYVTGLSNGAMMTSTVACVFADRIAAAAPVAGVADVEGCTPDRPVPMVTFHGTDDPFLDYEGGPGPAAANLPAPSGEGTLGEGAGGSEDGEQVSEVADRIGPSVPERTEAWAARNGCDNGAPTENEAFDDVTILTWPCPEGAEVELYRIEGGGHTWPGSDFLVGASGLVGTTTFSISANEVMWDFFVVHPLGGD